MFIFFLYGIPSFLSMSTAINNYKLRFWFFVFLFCLYVFFPRSGNSSMPIFSTGSGPFVKLNTAPNGSLILTPRWVPKSVLGLICTWTGKKIDFKTNQILMPPHTSHIILKVIYFFYYSGNLKYYLTDPT